MDNQSKIKEEISSDEEDIESQCQSSSSGLKITSEFTQDYFNYLKYSKNDINFLHEKVKSKMGFYKCQFSTKLSKKIKYFKNDSFLLTVTLGGYSIDVSVVILMLSMKHIKGNVVGNGSFGQAVLVQDQNQKIIIKRISFRNNFSYQNFDGFLKEFFFCFLADKLQLGPEVKKYFSYDIVVLEDQCFFCLQKCQTPLSKRFKENRDRIYNDLSNNLKIIHSIKMCHCDINPKNIVWSNAKNKYVFIDFGLSRFIEQPIGKKTKTYFFGTQRYCCLEMSKLFFSQQDEDFVDLYYNDCIGLRVSLEEIQKKMSFNKHKQTIQIINNQFGLQDNYSFTILKKILCIKNLFFEHQIRQVKKKIKKQNIILQSIYLICLDQLTVQINDPKRTAKYLNEMKRKFPSPRINFDQFFLRYLNCYYSNPLHLMLKIQSFIQNLEQIKLYISVFWQCQFFIKEVILFLDPFNTQIKEHLRRSVVQTVSDYFYPQLSDRCFFWKLRKVLKKIHQYLIINNTCLKCLEIIQNIFIIIEDFHSAFEVQLDLIDLYRKTLNENDFYIKIIFINIWILSFQYQDQNYIFEMYWIKIQRKLTKSEIQFVLPLVQAVHGLIHTQRYYELKSNLVELKEKYSKKLFSHFVQLCSIFIMNYEQVHIDMKWNLIKAKTNITLHKKIVKQFSFQLYYDILKQPDSIQMQLKYFHLQVPLLRRFHIFGENNKSNSNSFLVDQFNEILPHFGSFAAYDPLYKFIIDGNQLYFDMLKSKCQVKKAHMKEIEIKFKILYDYSYRIFQQPSLYYNLVIQGIRNRQQRVIALLVETYQHLQPLIEKIQHQQTKQFFKIRITHIKLILSIKNGIFFKQSNVDIHKLFQIQQNSKYYPSHLHTIITILFILQLKYKYVIPNSLQTQIIQITQDKISQKCQYKNMNLLNFVSVSVLINLHNLDYQNSIRFLLLGLMQGPKYQLNLKLMRFLNVIQILVNETPQNILLSKIQHIIAIEKQRIFDNIQQKLHNIGMIRNFSQSLFFFLIYKKLQKSLTNTHKKNIYHLLLHVFYQGSSQYFAKKQNMIRNFIYHQFYLLYPSHKIQRTLKYQKNVFIREIINGKLSSKIVCQRGSLKGVIQNSLKSKFESYILMKKKKNYTFVFN